jgi:DNA-binding XRE family transcriptional regulator
MSLQELKAQALQNAEVAQEYDRLASEFSLISQLISMREEAGLTQEAVALKMNTQKSNISRMERGNSNPSWSTLMKYANACGFELTLQPVKSMR